MKKLIESQREIPVIEEGEVIVTGGGPSGLIAGIASARNGVKTLLVERYGFLGGMSTAGLVGPISNFRFREEQIIDGIPWELIKRLQKKRGALISHTSGNISFDPETMKLVAQEMIEESGCHLLLHSWVGGVTRKENKIEGIIVENKSGREAILGKIFIDATGDADIAHFSDVPCQKSNIGNLQPFTLCFRLGAVDTDNLTSLSLGVDDEGGMNEEIRKRMFEAYNRGEIPEFGGPWLNYGSTIRKGEVSVNITQAYGDGTDARDLTKAELKTRRDMEKIVNFLKTNFPQFKKCYIINSATQIGVRETRRIKGKYTLTERDVLDSVRFSDVIAKGCHPIDIHTSQVGHQVLKWLENWYAIPYRCMIPQKIKNLIVTGRCISASRNASASLRVQATCMALGQAAGTAAALSIKYKKSPGNLSIKFLQKTLTEQKAKITQSNLSSTNYHKN